jgi:hypothetical protein
VPFAAPGLALPPVFGLPPLLPDPQAAAISANAQIPTPTLTRLRARRMGTPPIGDN